MVASYDEPRIAEFVSGDSEARAYATVEDTGDGWVVWNFPVDLAPPVPETGVFAPTDGVDPIFETFGNPDPTIIVCPGVCGDEDFGPADGTDPIVYVCDGYPLPREYCVLPMPVDFTSRDGADLADSGLGVDLRAYSTVGGTQSPTEIPPANDPSYGWMAAFASNLSGAGGDSPQPVTARRRGR